MATRLIPCADFAAEKRLLERARFIVAGCLPAGDDGMCLLSFDDPHAAPEPLSGEAAKPARVARSASRDLPSLGSEAAVAVAMASTSPPWDRSVPPAATAVVKRIEGFFATPYDDNGGRPGGTWTIGYGTIIDRDGRPVTAGTPPITETDAELLLRRDMEGAARDVAVRVKVPLSTCQAAALISWTYNLGGGNLAKSTMLMRVNAGRMGEVPAEMRKWVSQEGKPLVGLLRRRWAESAIFVGLEPANACVRAWREIDSLDDWPDF